jgi:hypothetical protein
MAILNPPNILPEAMRFLVRAVVAARSKVSEEELIDSVAPTGMAEAMVELQRSDAELEDAGGGARETGKTIASISLTALRHLQIVDIIDHEVSLGDRSGGDWRKPGDVTPMSFAVALEAALLTENGRRVGDDLLRACAVLAVADEPLRAFDAFDEAAGSRRFVDHQQRVLDSTDQSVWAVANKERWASLRRIGCYLGWVDPMDVSGRFGLVPNSASALRRWLPTLPADVYAAGDFLNMVSDRLPFLDDGDVSLRQIGNETALSGGLSLTLLALEHSGNLKLKPEADSATYEVSLGPKHSRLFSRVELLRTNGGKRGRA